MFVSSFILNNFSYLCSVFFSMYLVYLLICPIEFLKYFVCGVLTYSKIHKFWMFILRSSDSCVYTLVTTIQTRSMSMNIQVFLTAPQNSVVLCMFMLSSFSCVWLGDPMDCSLPGSSVHGILQARILESVAMPFSRGSSQSRDWTQFSHIAGGFFTI